MIVNGIRLDDEAQLQRIYAHCDRDVIAKLRAARAAGIPVLPAEQADVNRQFVHGILLAAGVPLNENVHPNAQGVAARGNLGEICRLWCDRMGIDHGGKAKHQLLRAGLRSRSKLTQATLVHRVALSGSQADFGAIVGDALEKSIAARKTGYTATSDRWVNRVNADRLKLTRFMDDRAWTLPVVEEGEAYPHKLYTLPDVEPNVYIEKRGEIIRVSRETLIMDDLEVIGDLSRTYAGVDSMIRDDLVYAILGNNGNAADGNALFSTAHANTTTGTLSVASIGAALGKLAAQTTAGNAPTPTQRMNLRARFLIVPVALQATAGQLVREFSVDGARLELIVEPRLDAYSTVQWYVAADPLVQESLVLAELNGETGLNISRKSDFDSDSAAFKVRYYIGAKALDWRSIVRSSGS